MRIDDNKLTPKYFRENPDLSTYLPLMGEDMKELTKVLSDFKDAQSFVKMGYLPAEQAQSLKQRDINLLTIYLIAYQLMSGRVELLTKIETGILSGLQDKNTSAIQKENITSYKDKNRLLVTTFNQSADANYKRISEFKPGGSKR